MSTPGSSAHPTSLQQQHKRAKELLSAARRGDASSLARIRAVRADAAGPARSLKLADAQLAIAREAGFPSWPALVAHFHRLDVQAFRDAIRGADLAAVRSLLAAPHVREHVNDPMFDFGQRAAHMAARHEAVLAALIDAGADVNLKSDWQNGPYTVLDMADEPTGRYLLARGAALTPNVAARLGWIDELTRFLDSDAALVHARGGDGTQPLHEAKTVAIADLLLDRGADVDARCIDHRSTPAQYALADRPDVCRRLLERGATPDIFMAARLGDVGLATRLLDDEPDCVGAHVNEPGYPPVPPFNIYCWSLGFGRSPHDVALNCGHRDVHDLLVARSPDRIRFVNAALAANEPLAAAMLRADPSLIESLPREDHGRLALAIFHERFDAADVMLRLGFDPAAPGMDGGDALHAACWVGHLPLVERLLAQPGVALDGRDTTHRSTPLGWAAFGSVHRRAPGSDYPGVIAALAKAGADISAPGNGKGLTLVEMARGNPAVQEVLRHLGAK